MKLTLRASVQKRLRMFDYESKYLVNYRPPYIEYNFPMFVGFMFLVPESEHPRYARVLQAYEGNLEEAQERLRITFQSDAERSYQEWINSCGIS